VPPTSGQTDGAEESREAKEELNPLAEDVSTPTEISIERPVSYHSSARASRLTLLTRFKRELPHRPALLKGVETLSNISLRLSPDQWSSLIEVAVRIVLPIFVSTPHLALSTVPAFASPVLFPRFRKANPFSHCNQ
jgi:hypothetical protein